MTDPSRWRRRTKGMLRVAKTVRTPRQAGTSGRWTDFHRYSLRLQVRLCLSSPRPVAIREVLPTPRGGPPPSFSAYFAVLIKLSPWVDRQNFRPLSSLSNSSLPPIRPDSSTTAPWRHYGGLERNAIRQLKRCNLSEVKCIYGVET